MNTNRTRIACNRFFITMAVGTAFLVWMVSTLFSEGEIVAGIGCAVAALIILTVFVLFMPFGYRFDPEGVTLCYLFVPNERYLWKKICAIEVDYSGRGPVTFRLEAKPEGMRRFYMDGQIHKNRRTKRLLEAYWDGQITGYFFEGLHNRWRKRRNKKEKEITRHIADEVIPMERDVRAETRTALALYDAQAAQLGLELRSRFCYMTETFEESNSRPSGNYTYSVLVELSRPGETDERRIITTGADLLHVRLGKTAYRGVRDGDALPDLRLELTEMLEQVRKMGMDAYCASLEEEYA